MVLFLQYHKIKTSFQLGGTWTTPKIFTKHLSQLSQWGFKTLRENELLNFQNITQGEPRSRENEKKVLITFDDGFSELHSSALPILQHFGMQAVVFVVAGFLGQKNTWDVPFDHYSTHLSPSQLKNLREAGWIIGSHSLTHPDLRILKGKELEKELKESKTILEDILQEEISIFSYPFGLLNPKVKHMVEKTGYKLAFTSRRSLHPRFDPYAIERQGVYIIDSTLFPKVDPFFLHYYTEAAKEIGINQFARLTGLVRHRFPWIGKALGISGR